MGTLAFNRNFEWSVADVDRVIAMAACGNTARQIATAMERTETAVLKLCETNQIFVRRQMRIGR